MEKTNVISGVEVARVLNEDANKVFKTGYVHGGCSPIGLKKPFNVVIDISAKNFIKTIIQ